MSSSAAGMERCQKRPRPHDADADRTQGPDSLSRPISPPRKRIRGSTSTINSPWHLTWIRDLPADHNRDALTLRDLLGDPLIAEAWQFNYLHDVPFVMDAFDPDTRHLVKVHIVHGFWKQDDPRRARLVQQAADYSNVQLHVAPMPEMFGTHHSKMMVLFRHDDSAQVIIHTANMIPQDWTNLTNGIWLSPMLPKLATAPLETTSTPHTRAIGTGQQFKTDLLNYLRCYDSRRSTCSALVQQLVQYDFSAIKAALVASVPGRHKAGNDDGTTWGWPALRNLLNEVPCKEGSSEIVVQISSIATLGAKDEWLRKSLLASLAASKTVDSTKPSFKVIFPTADEIRQSLDGYDSGGSIHTKIQSAQQAKQLQYLRPMLHHWANDSPKGVSESSLGDVTARDGGRQRAAPHIKTYIRYNKDQGIDWALLTSANLSKQAWGEAVQASGEVRIASWEIGVMIWPELIATEAQMVGAFKSDTPDNETIQRTGEGERTTIGVRIPYSIPLQRYGRDEVPWVATMAYTEPDWKGNSWVD